MSWAIKQRRARLLHKRAEHACQRRVQDEQHSFICCPLGLSCADDLWIRCCYSRSPVENWELFSMPLASSSCITVHPCKETKFMVVGPCAALSGGNRVMLEEVLAEIEANRKGCSTGPHAQETAVRVTDDQACTRCPAGVSSKHLHKAGLSVWYECTQLPHLCPPMRFWNTAPLVSCRVCCCDQAGWVLPEASSALPAAAWQWLTKCALTYAVVHPLFR